jgi:hypothetical protein
MTMPRINAPPSVSSNGKVESLSKLKAARDADAMKKLEIVSTLIFSLSLR